MHAGVMQWQTPVHICPVHSNPLGQAILEHERVAVDGGLVQAVPLVDVILGLHIH